MNGKHPDLGSKWPIALRLRNDFRSGILAPRRRLGIHALRLTAKDGTQHNVLSPGSIFRVSAPSTVTFTLLPGTNSANPFSRISLY
jgi:hypothetical protein